MGWDDAEENSSAQNKVPTGQSNCGRLDYCLLATSTGTFRRAVRRKRSSIRFLFVWLTAQPGCRICPPMNGSLRSVGGSLPCAA
jgi:hypothetical protein